jgi:hypothetical protein
MNKHGVFVTLLIIVLVLVSLSISAKPAKAYGNSVITANCPFFTVSATSDRPLTYPGFGQNYIVGFFQNLTTGRHSTAIFFPRRSEVIVTGSRTSYIRYYYEISLGTNGPDAMLSPGDQYSYVFLDKSGPVGVIKGVCNSATIIRNSYPSGYTLMVITCRTYILSSPGGPVLPPYNSVTDDIPELGTQRYVLPVGEVGPDGQVYDKIQAHAVSFGYYPRRCLA